MSARCGKARARPSGAPRAPEVAVEQPPCRGPSVSPMRTALAARRRSEADLTPGKARPVMLQNLPDFVGHALRDQRAGLDKTVYQRVPLRSGMASIRVTSLAFVDHGPIPVMYTADGEGISPPLQWSGLPPSTRSVVVIVEDADSPTPQPLVHAIAV